MTNQYDFTDTMQPIIELMYSQMRMEQENEVMKAVQSMGVNVDKERLTQALTDAHRFWHEGYAAGRRCKPEWISVSDRLPADTEKVLVYTARGNTTVARWSQRQEKFVASGNITVTHWRALPEKPEEGV